jgi:Flp pilus assembly protein TadB
MMFHRWGTISQIISTTKLPICERKTKKVTDEGNLQRHALEITKELMRDTTRRDEEENTKFVKGAAGRRQTVANLMRSQTEKRDRQAEDLEKRFKTRFQSFSKRLFLTTVFLPYSMLENLFSFCIGLHAEFSSRRGRHGEQQQRRPPPPVHAPRHPAPFGAPPR